MSGKMFVYPVNIFLLMMSFGLTSPGTIWVAVNLCKNSSPKYILGTCCVNWLLQPWRLICRPALVYLPPICHLTRLENDIDEICLMCVSTSNICRSLWLHDMMMRLLTWMKTITRRAESARRFIWKFNGLICCQMRSTKEQVKTCIIHIQFDWKCQRNIVNKVSILLISRKVLLHDNESYC